MVEAIQATAKQPMWLTGLIARDEESRHVDGSTSQGMDVVTPVSVMIDKERSCSDVYTGQRRRKVLQPESNKPVDASSCVGKMVLYESVKTDHKHVGEVIAVSSDKFTVHTTTKLRLNSPWYVD